MGKWVGDNHPMQAPPSTGDPSDPLDRIDQPGGLPFTQFVTFKVNQLSMAFERQWTRYMREQVGLSLGEWRVVATLAGAERLTFAAVVAATGMNKSLCSRCIASLLEAGWVESRPTPGDARSLTLQLTRKGRRQVEDLRPVVIKRQRMLLRALSRAERVALYSAIDKLQAAAVRWEDDQGGGATE